MVDNELERKPEKDDVKARDMEFKRMKENGRARKKESQNHHKYEHVEK